MSGLGALVALLSLFLPLYGISWLDPQPNHIENGPTGWEFLQSLLTLAIQSGVHQPQILPVLPLIAGLLPPFAATLGLVLSGIALFRPLPRSLLRLYLVIVILGSIMLLLFLFFAMVIVPLGYWGVVIGFAGIFAGYPDLFRNANNARVRG
jgi:hypothetical protein